MEEKINLEKRKIFLRYVFLVISIFSIITFFKKEYLFKWFENTEKKDLIIKYDKKGNIIQINNGKKIDYFDKGVKIKTKYL